jgi:hypothetical protein
MGIYAEVGDEPVVEGHVKSEVVDASMMAMGVDRSVGRRMASRAD